MFDKAPVKDRSFALTIIWLIVLTVLADLAVAAHASAGRLKRAFREEDESL